LRKPITIKRFNKKGKIEIVEVKVDVEVEVDIEIILIILQLILPVLIHHNNKLII